MKRTINPYGAATISEQEVYKTPKERIIIHHILMHKYFKSNEVMNFYVTEMWFSKCEESLLEKKTRTGDACFSLI